MILLWKIRLGMICLWLVIRLLRIGRLLLKSGRLLERIRLLKLRLLKLGGLERARLLKRRLLKRLLRLLLLRRLLKSRLLREPGRRIVTRRRCKWRLTGSGSKRGRDLIRPGGAGACEGAVGRPIGAAGAAAGIWGAVAFG